jgi:hypothetical protein
MSVLLALLLSAHAQETPAPSEVVSMTTVDIDVVTFDLPTCDKVRAEYRDARPGEPKAPKIKVVLRNRTGQMCLYKGLAFAGTLSGTYQSTITTPDGSGFFIPPDGEVELRLYLTPSDTPRDVIRMQIPPDSGLVVLEGFAAANAPGATPPPVTPPPAVEEPERGRKPSKPKPSR